MSTKMECNGLFCEFNTPEAIKDNGASHVEHGLPPYAKRPVYLVDDYKAVPNHWMQSSKNISSYFAPIKEGQGIWLDFNANSRHEYEVAIIVSVQGVNAISGMPCKETKLEQYHDKCPKHECSFEHDRYCPECGFKWPQQNYISTTSTPNGRLWIDGFRAIDGAVHQYIATKDKMRGVASNVIGEDRVFAIGLSFFLSKKKKEKPSPVYRGLGSSWNYNSIHYAPETSIWYGNNDSGANTPNIMCSSTNFFRSSDLSLQSRSLSTEVSKVEIGAGARIKQSIYDDEQNLSFWNKEPEAMICLNYCLEDECEEILQKGLKNHKMGFLQGVPVGN